MNAVRTNNWFEPAKHLEINQTTYRALERVRGELTVCSTYCIIILQGTRTVIPKIMQQRVIDLAHEGHQGIAKTKSLLREKVWFAGIDGAVEKKVTVSLVSRVRQQSRRQTVNHSVCRHYQRGLGKKSVWTSSNCLEEDTCSLFTMTTRDTQLLK